MSNSEITAINQWEYAKELIAKNNWEYILYSDTIEIKFTSGEIIGRFYEVRSLLEYIHGFNLGRSLAK